MNWEELSSDDFPQAVKDAQGVCVVPLSVVERHGHHLNFSANSTRQASDRGRCDRPGERDDARRSDPDNSGC